MQSFSKTKIENLHYTLHLVQYYYLRCKQLIAFKSTCDRKKRPAHFCSVHFPDPCLINVDIQRILVTHVRDKGLSEMVAMETTSELVIIETVVVRQQG